MFFWRDSRFWRQAGILNDEEKSFMSSETEEIKSRLSVVDVVGQYVRLTKTGINFKGLCPFHNEKSPSFSVNEERDMWHCFGCGKSGDIFTFLMEREGLSFIEVLKLLAERAGVELHERKNFATGKRDRTTDILESAAKYYEGIFWQAYSRSGEYVRSRGIRDEFARLFRLGQSPDGWDGILKHLLSNGFSAQEIEKSGLLVKKSGETQVRIHAYYDRFRDRLMFPVTDILGRVVGFSARVLPGADEKGAKYINTPETEVYHKSRILYGIAQAKQAIKERNAAIVVEGNMDVIAMHQAGFPNTVAVSGTALTSHHLGVLRRYSQRIVLFFDMDEAGQEAAKKSALLAFRYDMNVSVVILDQGKDAAELACQNPAELTKHVENARNAVEYFLERIFGGYDRNDLEAKKRIARESLAVVDALADSVEKETWIRRLADKLEVSTQALYSLLSGMRRISDTRHDPTATANTVIETSLQSRFHTLTETMCGLMLAAPNVWQHAVELLSHEDNEDIRHFLSDQSFLKMLFDMGEQMGYTFDTLRNSLHEDNVRSHAEQLYYDNAIEEKKTDTFEQVDAQDALKRFDALFLEMRKEAFKQRLQRITSDMKNAEAGGDKNAIILLSREFSDLSRRLHSL